MSKDSSQKARDDFLNDIENISKKERFGLFTQPPPLSINDDSLARRPLLFLAAAHNFRNFGIVPPKKGNYNDALFQNPGFITINDYYKDPFKAQQLYLKEKNDRIPHGQPFRTTHNSKMIIEPPYEYISGAAPKTFDSRDDQGNVKTGPRNFYTSSMISGDNKNSATGHLFSGYGYKLDPFESKDSKNLEDLINHRRKQLKSAKPFCSNSHARKAFTSDQEVYGDQDYQRKSKIPKFYGILHPYPFRPNNPAKKGYNKTISRFPTYYEEPESRQNLKLNTEKKDNPVWRPNYNGTLSKPCPAILKRICSARAKII